ncbi:M23 family peptidase [Neorhizobium sp. P12A]|uniref:M23 family metallopeptidase n=1 Tax=Neorhizobium sp. P12A TaxID=2268027 RepID=UPI0011EEDCEB|nr:M23 family metallopeptidase [Neorhizobium sp. P12A]KAA0695676.1 M23 family peptidase [Neorhizobium sp. P12A]
MAENPLYIQFPAEPALVAQPHHETFHLPFMPRSAHARHLIAVWLGAIGSFGLLAAVLYPLVNRYIVAPAVAVHPAQIVQSLPAMPKTSRLAMRRRFDGARFAQVAEQVSTGETQIFTYHRLTLVFKEDVEDRSGIVNADYEGEGQQDGALVATPVFADFRSGVYPQPDAFVSQRRSRFPVRGVPLNVSVANAGAVPTREFKRVVSMPKNRQELADILETAGVSDKNREELERALATDAVAPGNSLELLMEKNSENGRPKLIMAKLNGEKGNAKVVARDDSDSFVPVSDDRLFSTLYSESQPDAPSSSEVAAIDLNGLDDDDPAGLRNRLEKAGLSEVTANDLMKLADANGVPLNGSDDAPDSVDLLFRKSDGNNKTDLMFIEFHSGDEAHRFYLHRDTPDGASEFYDEDGHSVAKVLAHRPVPGGKLGDGFAWRIHPILGVKKFHNGVDFRAPMGSPILAAGDGMVEKISWETGYGKYVRIRHDGGYETTYAHIASTPDDLRVGERVKQGEVIAYVGSTGYSTGPHLYYELRVNGRYENPLTADLPAGTNLTGKSLDSLKSQVNHVDSIMSYLDASSEPQLDAAPEPQPEPFTSFDHRPKGHFGRP